MGEAEPEGPEQGAALLAMYDRALPQVYGYLLPRCGSVAVAEDLTAETFLAAVDAVQRDSLASLSIAWLVGVARHKLVDHWRRQAREERRLRRVESEVVDVVDPWDAELDVQQARKVLASLGAHHRAALTLRYVDGLPVAEVADALDRTVHATEALLMRAKHAFRLAYGDPDREGSDG
jgi:RNA polymerase sigma-70 factor (ECF subfamily)